MPVEPRPIEIQAGRVSSASYLLVAVLASACLCAVSFHPAVSVAKYRSSFAFLVPILWAAYAIRRRVDLAPSHYAMFAAALVLHDLGAFGFYSRTVAGLQFDWIVHTFFGLVGGLVLARALEIRLGVTGFALALLVVLAVTGMGALHEIVEAASTMFLGAERGMLYVGRDDPFDTQEDMLCNVIGSSAACAWRAINARR